MDYTLLLAMARYHSTYSNRINMGETGSACGTYSEDRPHAWNPWRGEGGRDRPRGEYVYVSKFVISSNTHAMIVHVQLKCPKYVSKSYIVPIEVRYRPRHVHVRLGAHGMNCNILHE